MTKPGTSIWSDGAADADEPLSSAPLSSQGRTSSAPALLRKHCPACGERYPTHFLVCPRDATELCEHVSEETDPMLGAVLDDTYTILHVIGEGGMGRVYEARHTRLFSKRFAIKVLHGDLTRQPEAVGRFLREAEATSALHHPNIVSVLDVNQVPDGRPYIVAELLEGTQLGDYFARKGKLPVREALAVCRPICQALIAAHERDIVHRDIKPENLFLVGEGAQRTVKVLDFGISRVGDAAGTLTKTGIVMGTPAYMPPEQALGQHVDHRADVYALGAILYEAVTGKAPFQGIDSMSTLGAVITQEPVPVRSLTPECPPELEDVIARAMAKSADERFANMREFDAALAAIGQPDEASERVERAPAQREMGETPQRTATSLAPSVPELPGLRGRLLRYYTASDPALARKHLWVLSLLTGLYLFAGGLALTTGVLRLARPDGSLTGMQILGCTLGSAVAISVPAIAWAQLLFWHVWPSTARVIDVLLRTQIVAAASFISYAAATVVVHGLHAFNPHPSALGWPGWDLIVFPLALALGGVVAWLESKVRGSPPGESTQVRALRRD